ncbi:hypothetical protein PTTG_05342 [Puccinia triticina 1-1 BBBD Race 1]|uniref:Uncharacterized protein n=1 Tax=Puccinia triticina (isolate 1-1 / race 1 (BBBD)) TaxID=630390 RepID=A0A0C4EWZ5_PUCT1|nr:hypothetical protein PTTG_05342 [Puccinia triticina 1-1 BBBD Race 1]
MDNYWVKANKKTPEFCKMAAGCMIKLTACVKGKLQPIVAANKGDVYGAMEALANACGEKSIIQLCNKLFALINCIYHPGSLLSQHLMTFWKLYTSLEMTIQSIPDFITISSGLAAALLLQSLSQDENLVSLVQSLYNKKPFTFEKVYDWLLIKDTRKESGVHESAYFLNQNHRFGKQSLQEKL